MFLLQITLKRTQTQALVGRQRRLNSSSKNHCCVRLFFNSSRRGFNSNINAFPILA